MPLVPLGRLAGKLALDQAITQGMMMIEADVRAAMRGDEAAMARLEGGTYRVEAGVDDVARSVVLGPKRGPVISPEVASAAAPRPASRPAGESRFTVAGYARRQAQLREQRRRRAAGE